MNITITPTLLIEAAKEKSGLAYSEMANEMHVSPNRISEWRKGKSVIGSDEVAYFADKAGLPIIDTVVALRPAWAHVWKRAGENWRKL